MDVYKYLYDLMDGIGALHWEAFMETIRNHSCTSLKIIDYVDVLSKHGLALGRL